MKTFGERLRQLRNFRGIGQVALAKAIGVSKAIVSLWENNLREPTVSNLRALVLFFNESADYLIGVADLSE